MITADDLCYRVSAGDSYFLQPGQNQRYHSEKKISLACHMLKNTNLTVRQIAVELSFADEYYFSNLFKKKKGVSPKKYRQTSR